MRSLPPHSGDTRPTLLEFNNRGMRAMGIIGEVLATETRDLICSVEIVLKSSCRGRQGVFSQALSSKLNHLSGLPWS